MLTAKNKIILACLLGAAICILLILIFIPNFTGRSNNTQINPTAAVPTVISTQNLQRVYIPAANQNGGEKIAVQDIISGGQQTADGTIVIDKPNQYQVLFQPQFEKFTLTILNSQFQNTRQTAEQDLLNSLGISKEQACKLSIAVTTTSDVNPDYSAYEYPLSFCLTEQQNLENNLGIFLSNHLPQSTNFNVTADYVTSPYFHYIFTVALIGADKTAAKQEFIDQLHQLQITDTQIQVLDIRYTNGIQSPQEKPPM